MARAGRGSGTLADVEVDDVRSRLSFIRGRPSAMPVRTAAAETLVPGPTVHLHNFYGDPELLLLAVPGGSRPSGINLGRRNRDNYPESARNNATQRLCPSASNCYNCASQKQKTVPLRQQRR